MSPVRLRLPQRREPVVELDSLPPFERAAARFNAGEAGRTVTGLVRTLGEPRVSFGARGGVAEEVRVTVAWDLTWYQWAVDVGPEGRPVVQIGTGVDLDRLDAAARQWNGRADAEGRIGLR